MFHRFRTDVSYVELPTRFNNPFYYRPHKLCEIAAEEVRTMLRGCREWEIEAAKGKMFGVLVVRDALGGLGYLAGFSGLLCGSNRQKGFVPPVFDFLSPDGYFKREERNISEINSKITAIKVSKEYLSACRAASLAEQFAERAIAERREQYASNKANRAAKRAQGNLSLEDEAELIRKSQFEKAELKRIAKKMQEDVAVARMAVEPYLRQLSLLAAERKMRSAALQEWLFTQFRVGNARGEKSSLIDIFRSSTGTLPPAGAGECAAPKMLQYAYEHNLSPVTMAEFWVGASPVGEIRHDGCFYGSCKSKCYPILSYMLQGLDVEESALERGGDNVSETRIIYEDSNIIVVDKPYGVLSVPGVVGGNSVQDWLRQLYSSNEIYVAHRLDMATSGILVAARSLDVLKSLQALFSERKVFKRYTALLDGVPQCSYGTISLPLAADYDNRPCQKVDYTTGKPSLTEYSVIRTIDSGGSKRALLSLVPVTGRTHQLRVHCAHKEGLSLPIVGDALYGQIAERLMLNASYISFEHPVTGEMVEFSCSAPFERF